MRLHGLVLAGLSLAPLCALLNAAAEEPLIEETQKPPDIAQYDEKYDEYLAAKRRMREKVAAARAAERAKVEADIQKLATKRAELEVPKTDSVNVDEETIPVTEPLSMEQAIKRQSVSDLYETSPADFDIATHDRWSLNKTDLLIDDPQHIVVDTRADQPRKYWGFTFSLTNSTTQPRRIAPVFVAVTNKGHFQVEAGGFLPQRLAADSLQRPLAGSDALADRELLKEKVAPLESVASLATQMLGDDGKLKTAAPPEPSATFQPGQVRWGIALWPDFDEEFTELKIVVHGLTNAHRYDRKLRRVLVLDFQREDDEYNVERTLLDYRGKEWQYLWMWDQEMSIPIPADPKDPQIKDKEITTPAGARRLIWSFPYVIQNSTDADQTLRIREVRFLLPVPDKGQPLPGVPVNVGGEKAYVEAPIVDDGRSSIYKAQYLREMNLADPARDANRFAPNLEKAREPGGLVYSVERGKKIEGRGVFDAADVDWTAVRQQVEGQLSLALDKKTLAARGWEELKSKAPGLAKGAPIPMLDPRRRLTDDLVTLKDGRQFSGQLIRSDEQAVEILTEALGRMEFPRAEVAKAEKGEMSQVKEQVLAAIPPALEAARKKKQVVAVLDCESGLSTGAYRVSRYYRQTGEIKEEWLKAWEELGQEPAEP
jgi:hypothetical protein